MAEKKKEKEITLQNKATIKYSGKVTVDRVRNGRLITTYRNHNEGTDELFKFILNVLSGNYFQGDLPRFVCEANQDGTSSSVRSATTSLKPISSIVSHTTGSDLYVEYKFYLPYDASNDTNGFNSLALYSENKRRGLNNLSVGSSIDSYSMIVQLSETIKPNVDEDLILTWQLRIENAQENQ